MMPVDERRQAGGGHGDGRGGEGRRDGEGGRRGGPLTAWLDVSAGVAGDMVLGALVDAGASLEVSQAAIDAVIPGTVRLVAKQTTRSGLRALKIDVELLARDSHHRPWAEIRVGWPRHPSTRRSALGRLPSSSGSHRQRLACTASPSMTSTSTRSGPGTPSPTSSGAAQRSPTSASSP